MGGFSSQPAMLGKTHTVLYKRRGRFPTKKPAPALAIFSAAAAMERSKE